MYKFESANAAVDCTEEEDVSIGSLCMKVREAEHLYAKQVIYKAAVEDESLLGKFEVASLGLF